MCIGRSLSKQDHCCQRGHASLVPRSLGQSRCVTASLHRYGGRNVRHLWRALIRKNINIYNIHGTYAGVIHTLLVTRGALCTMIIDNKDLFLSIKSLVNCVMIYMIW